jgi:hypothetical protein
MSGEFFEVSFDDRGGFRDQKPIIYQMKAIKVIQPKNSEQTIL